MGLALAGCGDKASEERSPEEIQQAAARATTLRPSDYELAQVYDRSCRTCHTNPSTGAPLTGDGEAWASRLAQGNQVLLDHAVRGYKGMPPLGMCPDCNLQQFRDLIAFMSTDASGEDEE
jgi:cytochrome c5